MAIASTSKLPPPSLESDEEEMDPRDFQAALDDSVNKVKNLVNSWIPKDLGPAWGSASPTTEIQLKARPPGLGLGANVGKIQAEAISESKLKFQLLKTKRNREEIELGNKLSEDGEELEESRGISGNKLPKINYNPFKSNLIPISQPSLPHAAPTTLTHTHGATAALPPSLSKNQLKKLRKSNKSSLLSTPTVSKTLLELNNSPSSPSDSDSNQALKSSVGVRAPSESIFITERIELVTVKEVVTEVAEAVVDGEGVEEAVEGEVEGKGKGEVESKPKKKKNKKNHKRTALRAAAAAKVALAEK